MDVSQYEVLREYFREYFPLSNDGLDDFISSFDVKCYKRGELLLSPERADSSLRFITNGSIREYYMSDYKEVNINFFIKPEFITDICSFNSNLKSHKWQEALSDVYILSMDKSRFDVMISKYPCGRLFFESLLQRMMQMREVIEFNRLTKSPEELYKCILENNAEWIHCLPQYHIAMFIGVTPETLSRIRKRIY
ncbi:MAG: Crp/Fnr family transcriptional regulator [Bacteroidales bacterium]